jgi:hypothetical protein
LKAVGEPIGMWTYWYHWDSNPCNLVPSPVWTLARGQDTADNCASFSLWNFLRNVPWGLFTVDKDNTKTLAVKNTTYGQPGTYRLLQILMTIWGMSARLKVLCESKQRVRGTRNKERESGGWTLVRPPFGEQHRWLERRC